MTIGERDEKGWGKHKFIALTNLISEDDDDSDDAKHPAKYMYIKNDSLYFKVTKVELK